MELVGVALFPAAQNRVFNHNFQRYFKVFLDFAAYLRWIWRISASPFLFHCLFSVSRWFFVCIHFCIRAVHTLCTRTPTKKPRNGLSFLLHLFVLTEKEIIKIQQKNNELKKVLIFIFFTQKDTLRYKMPTYDLVFVGSEWHEYTIRTFFMEFCCWLLVASNNILFSNPKRQHTKNSSCAESHIQVWYVTV